MTLDVAPTLDVTPTLDVAPTLDRPSADPDPGPVAPPTTLRLEDDALLRGAAVFTDDLPAGEDELSAVFVRSRVAAGRLVRVDTTAAAALPGVVAVLTAEQVDLDALKAFPPVLNQQMPQPILADAVVRYVGEPVALVAARSRQVAADAAALVEVEIEPTATVLDPRTSPGHETVLHPDAETNVALPFKFARPLRGDLFEGCEVVVEFDTRSQRVAACPLEVRTTIAQWDGPTLTYHAGTQAPHLWRDELAAGLGVEVDSVVVVPHEVGGAFGSKALPAAEDVAIAWLARRLAQPVRWTETRSDSLLSLGHGRAQEQHVRLGGLRDGTVLAYELQAWQDCGAYPRMAGVLPLWTRAVLTGPYDIRRGRFTCDSVLTNTVPVVAYRGAGQPEAVSSLERGIDYFAHELGLDPADVRRRNLVPADAMPYTSITRSVYDSGDYPRALELALDQARFPQLRQRQQARRESGATRLLGVGIASFVEVTGADVRPELARITVSADGLFTVSAGTSPSGQGHATTWATIMADELGIATADVRFVRTDTAGFEQGAGTGGSRSVQTAGVAVGLAARALIDTALELVATHLGLSGDDVGYDPTTGGVLAAGEPVAWSTLAQWGRDGAPVSASAVFTPTAPTAPYGTHVAVVEVDTDTGHCAVLDYVAVDDAGRLVHEQLAEGQVRGGVAQGVAQALYEQVTFAADGTPLAPGLVEYGMPTAGDLPEWRTTFLQTASPANSLGAKGIGESGAMAAPVAVQNAVVDALAHLGVRHIDMPLTPRAVWLALDAARRAGGS